MWYKKASNLLYNKDRTDSVVDRVGVGGMFMAQGKEGLGT